MFLKIVELAVPFKAFTSQAQPRLLSLFVSFRPVPVLQREGALAFQNEASVRSGDVILRGGGLGGPPEDKQVWTGACMGTAVGWCVGAPVLRGHLLVH